MKTEPLTIINFRHMPWSSSETPYRLFFTITGPELDGKKCKRLVRQLEEKLKNFSYKQDEINFHISELDNFFFYRANESTQVNGGWHSLRIFSSFEAKDEENRREDLGRMPALVSKEFKKLRFSHYATKLIIISVEPK